jgi:hypothetical protein
MRSTIAESPRERSCPIIPAEQPFGDPRLTDDFANGMRRGLFFANGTRRGLFFANGLRCWLFFANGDAVRDRHTPF